jgi:hypothetical protein
VAHADIDAYEAALRQRPENRSPAQRLKSAVTGNGAVASTRIKVR